jgi:hypothetical protein
MTKGLTRDTILECTDLRIEEVQVPEWGGSVFVRELTGNERDQYEASLLTLRGTSASLHLQNARAKLVVMSAVDEEGKRLFTMTDVAALGKKSAAALDRLATVASKLSGLSEADMSQLTANFIVDQNGGSISN